MCLKNSLAIICMYHPLVFECCFIPVLPRSLFAFNVGMIWSIGDVRYVIRISVSKLDVKLLLTDCKLKHSPKYSTKECVKSQWFTHQLRHCHHQLLLTDLARSFPFQMSKKKVVRAARLSRHANTSL